MSGLITDQVPFNPLDRLALAENVAAHLEDGEFGRLPPAPFNGAGIYAIYYAGDDDLYARLAGSGRPIYVGKATPAGGRIGGLDPGATAGSVLYRRLAEHAESIGQATNLNLADFRCRYLVVEDIWIPLGEQLLINRHRPLWNVVVAGFGNHDPGASRYTGKRPLWDELHPGRPWAARMLTPADMTAAELVEIITLKLAEDVPPETDRSELLSAIETSDEGVEDEGLDSESYEPPALGERTALDDQPS